MRVKARGPVPLCVRQRRRVLPRVHKGRHLEGLLRPCRGVRVLVCARAEQPSEHARVDSFVRRRGLCRDVLAARSAVDASRACRPTAQLVVGRSLHPRRVHQLCALQHKRQPFSHGADHARVPADGWHCAVLADADRAAVPLPQHGRGAVADGDGDHSDHSDLLLRRRGALRDRAVALGVPPRVLELCRLD
eukprot:Amastigsp_a677871_58.p4 type:complete len:191 gc:universal Amastigsp_a677871_58:1792-1220(-)